MSPDSTAHHDWTIGNKNNSLTTYRFNEDDVEKEVQFANTNCNQRIKLSSEFSDVHL